MDIENKYGALAIQYQLLTLLQEFHRFATENDIKYSLDWGSLLGAVRNKGFIPWDDDLDIMVDRDNYNRILQCSKMPFIIERDTESALWVNRIRPKNTGTTYTVPTIDIFVIDNAPDNPIQRKLRVLELRFLQGMMKGKPTVNKGNVLYSTASLISYIAGFFFSNKQKIRLYERLSQKSNKKTTKFKASYNTSFSDMDKLYSNNVIEEVIEVPFETINVCITKEYHQCLVDKFGKGYMTPPPESERVPRHI